jgi:hypothetical protein
LLEPLRGHATRLFDLDCLLHRAACFFMLLADS